MTEGAGQYDLVVEHQSSYGPKVLQVRGSLIASSLQSLRRLELFDRYILSSRTAIVKASETSARKRRSAE